MHRYRSPALIILHYNIIFQPSHMACIRDMDFGRSRRRDAKTTCTKSRKDIMIRSPSSRTGEDWEKRWTAVQYVQYRYFYIYGTNDARTHSQCIVYIIIYVVFYVVYLQHIYHIRHSIIYTIQCILLYTYVSVQCGGGYGYDCEMKR